MIEHRKYEKLTDERRADFLERLAATGLLYTSAHDVGVSGGTVRSAAKKDKDFAAAIEEAKSAFTDTLIAEVHRRGVEGVEKPIYQRGERVDAGEVKEYSDRLLELLLKRQDPSFRDSVKVEGNIAAGVLVVDLGSATHEEWAKRHNGPEVAGEEEKNPDEIGRE